LKATVWAGTDQHAADDDTLATEARLILYQNLGRTFEVSVKRHAKLTNGRCIIVLDGGKMDPLSQSGDGAGLIPPA